VLVDEVQDFSLEALRLIRVLSPLDDGTRDPLCLVGDGHQRIYRLKIPLSRAGIDVRGRSRRLKINYRTSEQIRTYAQGILQGLDIDDLEGGTISIAGDHSVFKGPEPLVK
jgi:superfamily I DNA/RNA helicase